MPSASNTDMVISNRDNSDEDPTNHSMPKGSSHNYYNSNLSHSETSNIYSHNDNKGSSKEDYDKSNTNSGRRSLKGELANFNDAEQSGFNGPEREEEGEVSFVGERPRQHEDNGERSKVIFAVKPDRDDIKLIQRANITKSEDEDQDYEYYYYYYYDYIYPDEEGDEDIEPLPRPSFFNGTKLKINGTVQSVEALPKPVPLASPKLADAKGIKTVQRKRKRKVPRLRKGTPNPLVKGETVRGVVPSSSEEKAIVAPEPKGPPAVQSEMKVAASQNSPRALPLRARQVIRQRRRRNQKIQNDA